MKTRKMLVRDENIPNSYIEFQLMPNGKSISINIESQGQFASVMCDLKHFKRAADEMML